MQMMSLRASTVEIEVIRAKGYKIMRKKRRVEINQGVKRIWYIMQSNKQFNIWGGRAEI